MLIIKAANSSQLFTFIQADLVSFKPKHKPAIDMEGGFTEPSDTEPEFPKSLYLISPLTMSYELKPVAPMAQASVPVPEGLDLDAWIASPPPPEETPIGSESAQLTKKKKGKGKEKAENGIDKVKKKKQQRIPQDVVVVEETQEEKAERELVSKVC